MQKLASIFLIILLAAALAIPILANNTSNTAMGANVANSSINTFDASSSGTDYGDNSSNIDNINSVNNRSVNTKLTSGQIQSFKDVQHKLGALITIIEGLKATYNNKGNIGTLNTLDQFEQQANSLNNEITAFIQNPTTENTADINGKISSFQAREAALEHKVSVKENALLAQTTAKTVNNVPNINKKNK